MSGRQVGGGRAGGEGGAPLLVVRDLAVAFRTDEGSVAAVERADFVIRRGETLALVGESGSGKSVTALSVLQLLPYPRAFHPRGSIRLAGEELVGRGERRLRAVRGARVGMIFQEPMTSLNPLHTVERQIGESLRLHRGLRGAAARARVLELLRLVALPEPEQRLASYPHQLSGGQRQRVMIAMALANEPELLIADEPTTALDVTVQAEILALIADLRRRLGMAVLLISHDLTVVRRIADRVCVMQGGRIVETAATAELLRRPQHPYTRALLAAEPSGSPAPAADAPPLLRLRDLKVHFPVRRGLLRRTVATVRAVDGVDLAVRPGETVGVVGESGSGKTTLGMAALRLLPSQGAVLVDGRDVQGWSWRRLRPLRHALQIVFQDPFGSLNPRFSVRQIVEEGLLIHEPRAAAAERRRRVEAALVEVGLDPAAADRYPHEFSGGQRQRVAVARAVVLRPRLVVLDEPTSALDLSIQAQIVDLLRDLQARHGLAYLFISHDLRVVRAMSHRILVMQGGRIVEEGATDAVFERPQQAYTRALLAAAFVEGAAPVPAK